MFALHIGLLARKQHGQDRCGLWFRVPFGDERERHRPFHRPDYHRARVIGVDQGSVAGHLAGSGLTMGTVTRVANPVAAGHVIAQNSPPGTIEPAGSPVDLTISLGAVAVPDLESLTAGQAISALHAVGLAAHIQYRAQCVDPGLVIDQTTSAGTSVAPGSTVTVTIASGTLHSCCGSVTGSAGRPPWPIPGPAGRRRTNRQQRFTANLASGSVDGQGRLPWPGVRDQMDRAAALLAAFGIAVTATRPESPARSAAAVPGQRARHASPAVTPTNLLYNVLPPRGSIPVPARVGCSWWRSMMG